MINELIYRYYGNSNSQGNAAIIGMYSNKKRRTIKKLIDPRELDKTNLPKKTTDETLTVV